MVGEEMDKNKDKFKFLASVCFTSLGGENDSDQRAGAAFAKPQICAAELCSKPQSFLLSTVGLYFPFGSTACFASIFLNMFLHSSTKVRWYFATF